MTNTFKRPVAPVKIKQLHADAVIPRYARAFDAGFDLVAVEDVIILPGETAKIPTGLAFALPDGYELQVRPRSGISAKSKLRISNAPGTVDAGYRGEVCVLIDNIRTPSGESGKTCMDVSDKPVEVDREVDRHAYLIRKGDRIAQGVLAIVPIAYFEVVEELDETERGAGGFGSSGVQ
ncbi:dUTP diphosphatase [Brevibacillus borstelensis]|uniref:dUTP diphosphatase n=1 Tax=Brevibacillus borstelensis TaxID=45462 RepID=UPI00203FE240|nr:deoxyuridine 5'-triphosphate nucleotidohydrolase [Brevibacillus borstelensis]MCM3469410.1 deoxyuridine 5'-triphosphate nucleotidohydrolase [Brevibacillus borstelensis]MCM3557294.1 deoxyuridine 5'-triphosphate nucleotidohydrolase [Brevibacillus borstelensis]MCM3590929.1 deoxyuridine 5'-triphosphate nucleotidohydrolase [Brevibacillus borstelensis]